MKFSLLMLMINRSLLILRVTVNRRRRQNLVLNKEENKPGDENLNVSS